MFYDKFKKQSRRLKHFCCMAILKRDFMINRLQKNISNNYEEFDWDYK